jgi:hypothetical protein
MLMPMLLLLPQLDIVVNNVDSYFHNFVFLVRRPLDAVVPVLVPVLVPVPEIVS